MKYLHQDQTWGRKLHTNRHELHTCLSKKYAILQRKKNVKLNNRLMIHSTAASIANRLYELKSIGSFDIFLPMKNDVFFPQTLNNDPRRSSNHFKGTITFYIKVSQHFWKLHNNTLEKG